MSKIIYVCKTEEEFKELCFIFDYPKDVFFSKSSSPCLRVENGKAIGHGGLSWYESKEKYKDYELILYRKGMLEEAIDDVKSQLHYKLEGLDIESKHAIKEILGKEGYKDWCHETALKYLFRAGKKEDKLKDYKKVKEYISWIIEETEE